MGGFLNAGWVTMVEHAAPTTMEQFHLECAKSLFNRVWELMDKSRRTVEENDEMVHAAHASRYHWSQVGEPVNLARGEWQVSRVHAILGRPAAVHHARRCLELCKKHGLSDFDHAAAYEAMARAAAVVGDSQESQRYLTLGFEAAEKITDVDDRKLVTDDLQSLTGYGRGIPR